MRPGTAATSPAMSPAGTKYLETVFRSSLSNADAAPARLVDEAGDRRHVQMTDDLREVILRIEAVVRHVFHLLDGVRVRVGPSPEDEPRFPRADLRAQLPRVLDASRPADALVAAEDDERREAVLPRLLCIRQTEVQRMFRRQER